MFRLTTLAALTITMFTSSAYAEINEKRYSNLKSVQCEDEQTIADMEEIWKSMRSASGSRTPSRMRIVSSKTKVKSAGKLICDVVVKIKSYKTRGTFSLIIFPNGKVKIRFNAD